MKQPKPRKKYHHYSLKTKIKVIWAKKEGQKDKDIQQRFKITNRCQIGQWCRWFDQNQIERLKQPRGKQYKYQQPPYAHIKTPLLSVMLYDLKQILGHDIKQHYQRYLQFIKKYQSSLSLNRLLKFLRISKHSYYRWLKPKTINHQQPNHPWEQTLSNLCHQYQYQNLKGQRKYRLGYRKIHYLLNQKGFNLSLKKVYQQMKRLNLLSNLYRPRYRYQKYIPTNITPLNLLQNNFKAQRPYHKLCTDITYLTYEHNHYLYLSAIIDLYNREIVSYHLSTTMDTNLIIKTVNQLPPLKQPCYLHSDQGAQYTSKAYQQMLTKKNITPSFSEKKSPSQNACIESFWALLKQETIYLEPKKLLTKKKLIMIVNNYIAYYNQARPLKYLNYQTPLTFKHHQQTINTKNKA